MQSELAIERRGVSHNGLSDTALAETASFLVHTTTRARERMISKAPGGSPSGAFLWVEA